MEIFSEKSVIQKSSSRSEEHTSELQSPDPLVCRLLLEKKYARGAPPAHRCLSRCPGQDLPRPKPRPAGCARGVRAPQRGTAPRLSRRPAMFFFKRGGPPKTTPFSLPEALPI